MISIEQFLWLAALVAAIGLVVRWRDRRSGDRSGDEPDGPSISMRDRLADTGFLPDAAWRARNARPGAASRRRRNAGGADDRAAGV